MRCTPFIITALACLATYAAAAPRSEMAATPPHLESEIPRLVIYFQTTHDKGSRPISMLPLVFAQHIALTHLIVCTIHIHKDGVIHLNDHLPSDPRFKTLWLETYIMRQSGVKVMGMIGGAAGGSFTKSTLDSDDDRTFEHYYQQLAAVIRQYNLQGLDIDVEQPMSQHGINRLILRLRLDFGGTFIITLAPVASGLTSSYRSLSGFSYPVLEREHGQLIDFYNAQFYNGFGRMQSTTDFDNVVAAGWNPTKIVIGQLTDGWQGNAHAALNNTIVELQKKWGVIGGVMGWEYFNSLPGGEKAPWKWAQVMTKILRPGLVPEIRMTRETAMELTRAWVESARAGLAVICASVGGAVNPACAPSALIPNVDYMGMVNA